MKRFLMGLVACAATVLIADSSEAQVRSRYAGNLGGPRIQVNIGTGFGYRGGGRVYRQLPPYGFTATMLNRQYGNYSYARRPQLSRSRRSCDYRYRYGY